MCQRSATHAAFSCPGRGPEDHEQLLRMADLLAMQPNLTIPLYLVAPDERRNKVLTEVNRPTFSRLSPPLKHACRYLAFSVLRDQLPEDPRVVRHLTPAFLGDFSESCEIE